MEESLALVVWIWVFCVAGGGGGDDEDRLEYLQEEEEENRSLVRVGSGSVMVIPSALSLVKSGLVPGGNGADDDNVRSARPGKHSRAVGVCVIETEGEEIDLVGDVTDVVAVIAEAGVSGTSGIPYILAVILPPSLLLLNLLAHSISLFKSRYFSSKTLLLSSSFLFLFLDRKVTNAQTSLIIAIDWSLASLVVPKTNRNKNPVKEDGIGEQMLANSSAWLTAGAERPCCHSLLK